MRRALICLVATALLVLALAESWGGSRTPDGSSYEVSLHGVTLLARTVQVRPTDGRCSWWFDPGDAALCQPGQSLPYALVRLVFPLLAMAAVFMLVAAIPPIARRRAGVVLVTLASALALGGTVAAIVCLPDALLVFEGGVFEFGGAGFVSALAAVAVLGLCVSSFVSQTRSWTGIGQSIAPARVEFE